MVRSIGQGLLKIIAGTFGIEETALLGGDLRGDVREVLVQPCTLTQREDAAKEDAKIPSVDVEAQEHQGRVHKRRADDRRCLLHRAGHSGQESKVVVLGQHERVEKVRPAEQVVNQRFFGCWFVIRFEFDQLPRPRLVLLRALVPGEKKNARATLFRDERGRS